MVDISTNILIERPKELVSHYASDPDNATAWYVNIKSVDWKTPKPLACGSRVTFTAEFFGRRLTYVYEVIEFVPGEKLVMSTADGPFPMETTYTWEVINETTTNMTLRNRGYPSGFSQFLAPFMSFAMKRANRKDLRALKSLLEKR